MLVTGASVNSPPLSCGEKDGRRQPAHGGDERGALTGLLRKGRYSNNKRKTVNATVHMRSKAQAGCRELICEHSMFLSQVSSQTPGYSSGTGAIKGKIQFAVRAGVFKRQLSIRIKDSAVRYELDMCIPSLNLKNSKS